MGLIFAALTLLEKFIAVTPGFVADLKAILDKPSPTPDDWKALKAKIKANSYADYVPASALPAAAAAAPVQDPPAPAVTVQPYLVDGSRNPDFQHL